MDHLKGKCLHRRERTLPLTDKIEYFAIKMQLKFVIDLYEIFLKHWHSLQILIIRDFILLFYTQKLRL